VEKKNEREGGRERKREEVERNARERTHPEGVEFSPLLLLLPQGGKDIAHAHPTHLEGKENGMCFGAQTNCC
jgi:hypothetical protein